MQQIILHTHQINSGTNIQVLNVFAQNLPFSMTDQFFSAGLHPWHIGKVDPDNCLLAIEKATVHENLLAIGECGLDRSVEEAFAVQELYFKRQIEIAEKYHKPLIIHCVRAYPDLIIGPSLDYSWLQWKSGDYKKSEQARFLFFSRRIVPDR